MSSGIRVQKGLEGVYVTESAISFIDLERGALYYSGYDVRELVERSRYEEIVFLLLNRRLPTAKEYDAHVRELVSNMRLGGDHLDVIRSFVSKMDPLSILATLMVIEGSGKQGGDPSDTSSAVRAVSRMGAFFSTIVRLKLGGDYIPPRSDLGFVENMLYMIRGEPPTSEEAAILDDLLILHAEHGIPASTFACLVAASTLSDLFSSVAAGILALKGPLHGGASEASYKQALEIGDPARVPEWVEEALRSKRKIMGFGHRVYKTYDPRALIVKEIIRRLEDRLSQEDKMLLRVTQALEEYGEKKLANRGIYPNVDLWTPIVYRALGLPEDTFTPLFAVSRTAGWAAHILEYWTDNKLIRPLHLYTGDKLKQYVPIELRSGS
ncbi:MAG: citrate/2-methylcitrate synthase [Candidatus Caldarchaeales archaeon]|nr:citrate/2-methylcitrate synthase [Candidatus Caldarchaeales archaeon]MDT7915281.1 citrate/2-methylcitrate synthase [Candidatus Caldarchaeales archaeon]